MEIMEIAYPSRRLSTFHQRRRRPHAIDFVSVKIHLLGVISTREAGEYIVRRADDRVTAYIKAIFDQGQPIRCLGPPDLSLAA
jgi:hypothetical protein